MIRTLVVEDDQFIAETHRVYVERVPGFEVVGVAHCGTEAIRMLTTQEIDLVLLDFYLPDTSGLQVCRTLRAAGRPTDVIAVTSARDLDIVRSAVSLGVVNYLLKPFSFASFRQKLEGYAEYRRQVAEAPYTPAQDDVDRVLAALREPTETPLPKGVSSRTLTVVVEILRAGKAVSAAEIALAVGVSRPTARRYLDYLASQRLVTHGLRYGSVGRPERVYTWEGHASGLPAAIAAIVAIGTAEVTVIIGAADNHAPCYTGSVLMHAETRWSRSR